MSTIFDNDVLIHHVMVPGLPGTGFTAPEATQMRTDMDTMLARPVIDALDDIPDVNATGPEDGQVLVWDDAANAWVLASLGNPVAVTAFGDLLSPAIDSARIIDFAAGLTVTSDEPFAGFPRATASVNFAGTGGAFTAARSDHTHTNTAPTITTFAGTGYMSGGNRTLVTTNVTLANGISHVVTAYLRIKMRGADSGAANYRLTTSINGNARQSPAGGGDAGLSCVQGVPDWVEWIHTQTIVGTGEAVACVGSISWDSGAGMNVGFGEMLVDVRAAR